MLLSRRAYLFLNLAVMASFTLTRVLMLIFAHALCIVDLPGDLSNPSSFRRDGLLLR